MTDNRKATYYREAGGYAGARRVRGGRWVGFNRSEYSDLLKLDAFVGQRWQGPPSPAIVKAMKLQALAKKEIEGDRVGSFEVTIEVPVTVEYSYQPAPRSKDDMFIKNITVPDDCRLEELAWEDWRNRGG